MDDGRIGDVEETTPDTGTYIGVDHPCPTDVGGVPSTVISSLFRLAPETALEAPSTPPSKEA